MKVQQLIGKVKLGAKKNAPELLLGLGLVTGTACVITSSRATVKAAGLTKDLEKSKVNIITSLEEGFIDDVEMKNQLRQTYAKYALELAKQYAIPTALYAATVASVFGSYKIQKNRQMALSAALTACTTAYASLMGKLKNGAKHGLTAQEVIDGVEVKEHIDQETGEVTMVKEQGEPIDMSLYKSRFDRYSPTWEPDKFQNQATLRAEENWANDKLRLQGYLFLNDVYARLGLPAQKHGQIVGWKFDGEGDGFVSFGIKDAAEYEDVRYDDNAFDLEFNVDGDILTNF